MPRRKLTRKQIGEGFFSNMFKKGVTVFKKHAKKHVSAAISHGKKVAKAAAAEAKQQAIAYAKQQLEQLNRRPLRKYEVAYVMAPK